MKHLIVTEDVNSLGIAEYDRIILDTTTNEIVYMNGITYEYVDLGLSVKWAKCNVGAKTETDYGYYFQWGDTADKSNAECSWASYKHCNGSYTTLKKYNNTTEYGENPDNKITLDPEDDAATQIMGGNWRMPTKDEIQELLDNTTKELTQVNGVNGCKFTSNKEGYQNNSIFIPASGYRANSSFYNQGGPCRIWSSSINTSSPDYACSLYTSSNFIMVDFGSDRIYGYSVRGVRK